MLTSSLELFFIRSLKCVMCSRSPRAVISITVTCSERQYLVLVNLPQPRRNEVPGAVYRVFRKFGNDESLHVACRDELEQAVQLVRDLKALWPGQYVIKLSGGVGSVLERKGSEVWFVAPDQTVYEAIERMADKGVGALLVISAGKLVGIVSERDYTRKVILKGKSSKTTSVNEIMTSPVVFVTPDKAVDECMEIITRNRIRHLPVMDDNKVLGV